jgi:hypothetical protein
MTRSSTVRMGVGACALLAAAVVGATAFGPNASAQGRGGGQAPRLQVDPLWPKPLGSHWILGSVTGVAVDAQDHIWVTHRGVESLQANEKGPTLQPWASECCFSAPQVLEFDAAGTLVSHWGEPGQAYQWPQTPSGIAIDAKGNVWIAGAGNPPPGPGRRGGPPPPPPPPQDAQVLEFSKTGQFIRQIGKPGDLGGPDSQTALNRPAMVAVDNAANEIYVADGLGTNHRVIVFDAASGAYKRHWGAYGNKPEGGATPKYDPNAPASKQFGDVTCVKIAKDGMVYVCDRTNDRIQVFQKDGKFVKEQVVSKTTLGDGSVWDVSFSGDPQQRFLYVADGTDKRVWVLNRSSLEVVTSFGDGGRLPGHFYAVGTVAVDSKGNVYTGENAEGKRVQKWLYRGLGAPAPSQDH